MYVTRGGRRRGTRLGTRVEKSQPCRETYESQALAVLIFFSMVPSSLPLLSGPLRFLEDLLASSLGGKVWIGPSTGRQDMLHGWSISPDMVDVPAGLCLAYIRARQAVADPQSVQTPL